MSAGTTGLTVAALTLIAAFTATGAVAEDAFYGIEMEELEYRATDDGGNLLVWNGDAFYGVDEVRIRLRSEGDYDLDSETLESFSNQLTLQTPISDFWDIKGGFRLDSPDGPDRWYGTVGISGLAPQWVEIDADFYVSQKGKSSVRLDMEYEILLTNHLILTPSADLEAAFSSDREIGIGSGVSSAEIGLRLSYDILDRSLSPYVGIVYERKFGRTADFAREEGEETQEFQAVIGMKLLF